MEYGIPLWISFVGVIFSIVDFGLGFSYMNSIEAYVRCWISTLDTGADYYTTCANAQARHTNNEFSAYTTMWSFAVSSISIGGLFAPIPIGIISDKFGRKRGLLTLSVVGILGHCFVGSSWLANSYALLIVGRLLAGFHGAAIIASGPPYLNEIAPASLLGLFGAAVAMSMSAGMLVGSVLSLPQVLGNQTLWPWLTVIGLVLNLAQIVCLYFSVESPEWLNEKGRVEEVSWACKQIYKSDELSAQKAANVCSVPAVNNDILMLWKRCFTNAHIRSAILKIGWFYALQDITGCPVIIQYSAAIFKSAQIPLDVVPYINIAVFAVTVAGSLSCGLVVDKWGRKLTYSVSAIGITVCFLLVFILDFFKSNKIVSYTTIAPIAIFQVFSQLGVLSVPFIMASEWVAADCRVICNTFATLVGCLSQFAMGFAFPAMLEGLEKWTFLVLAGVCLSAFVFVRYVKLELTVEQKSQLNSKRTNSFISLVDNRIELQTE